MIPLLVGEGTGEDVSDEGIRLRVLARINVLARIDVLARINGGTSMTPLLVHE